MSYYSDFYDGPEPEYYKQTNKSKMTPALKTPTKAIITNITGDGTWNDQFKFVYTFSDGVIMSATHKENTSPFKEGQEVIYTVNFSNAHGNLGIIKYANEQPKKSYSGGSGWKPKSIEELKNEQLVRNPSMALAYAKDYHTANGVDGEPINQLSQPHEVVLATAELYLNWLNERTKSVQ